MNIHLLKLFGNKIDSTKWDDLSKQIVWMASTISFYTSCRMGEIVSGSKDGFDPKTTVTWENVIFLDEGEAIVHVPYTKTTGLKGTILNVFPTKNSTCPFTMPFGAYKQQNKKYKSMLPSVYPCPWKPHV